MNQPEKVWPLLKHSPDPRVRSYLIHRLGPMGADAGAIVKRLDEEPDLTIRRALLLSLGEFGEKEFAARRPERPAAEVAGRCTGRRRDPGLHAAAEWLLRRWKQEAWLKQVNEEWAKDKEQREKRLEGIEQGFGEGQREDAAAVVRQRSGTDDGGDPRPGGVRDGIAADGRRAGQADEMQHKKRIGRTFALAAKSVTIGTVSCVFSRNTELRRVTGSG